MIDNVTYDEWNGVRALKNKPLIYVHTPKCGGTYVKSILADLGIKSNGHNRVDDSDYNNYIVFTVFRDPVKRFESFLNYRLSKNLLRDFPINIRLLVKENKLLDLNQVMEGLKNEHILSFYPFSTLNYWYKNIDIVISIEQIHKFLSFFGYSYDESKYKVLNASVKKFGSLNSQSIERLQNCLEKDIFLYNKLFDTNEKNK